MGFTIDVFLIQQPLGVGASELAKDRRRRAGNEWEYAAGAEFLHAGRGRADRLDHVASVSQVVLQCIAHDILETPPLQRGFGLRAPKQLIRDVNRCSHQRILASMMRLCVRLHPFDDRYGFKDCGSVQFRP